jgi:DNA-binding MarR family transcriptional regulator
MSTAAKTISITEPQRKALLWAISVWRQTFDGYDEELTKEDAAEIRGARKALANVYDELDPLPSWLVEALAQKVQTH